MGGADHVTRGYAIMVRGRDPENVTQGQGGQRLHGVLVCKLRSMLRPGGIIQVGNGEN